MSEKPKLPAVVNGVRIFLHQEPIGREVTIAAGLRPPEDYMILQFLQESGLEEISLDERVNLNEASETEFVAFKADRLFYAKMNDVRFPWKEQATEEELQKIAASTVPVDIWLSLEEVADRKLQPGEVVSLGGAGIERFYSKARVEHHGPFNIVVNGRRKTVAELVLTYQQVVLLAFPDGPFGPKINYTVTYAYHHGDEGSMVEGSSVKVKEGMVFNVSRTDQS